MTWWWSVSIFKHTGIFVHVARTSRRQEKRSPLHHSAAETVGIYNPPNATEHVIFPPVQSILLRIPSLQSKAFIRVGPARSQVRPRTRRKSVSINSSYDAQLSKAKGEVSGGGGHRHAWWWLAESPRPRTVRRTESEREELWGMPYLLVSRPSVGARFARPLSRRGFLDLLRHLPPSLDFILGYPIPLLLSFFVYSAFLFLLIHFDFWIAADERVPSAYFLVINALLISLVGILLFPCFFLYTRKAKHPSQNNSPRIYIVGLVLGKRSHLCVCVCVGLEIGKGLQVRLMPCH